MTGHPGAWFVITEGPRAGTIHMQGWIQTGFYALGDFRRGEHHEYIKVSVCPRCGVPVFGQPVPGFTEDEYTMPDLHERWHEMTDHRVPDHVRAQADLLLAEIAEAQGRRKAHPRRL